MPGAGIITIILLLAGFTFFALGYTAQNKEEPHSLWPGRIIETNGMKRKIKKWNEQVGALLKTYSYLFLLTGLCSFLSQFIPWLYWLVIGCFVILVIGTIFLVWRYRELEQEYKIKYVEL